MKAKRQYCCFLLAMLLSIMLSSCSRPPARGTEKTHASHGNLGCRAENRCVWRGTRLESFLRAVCAGGLRRIYQTGV